MQIPPALFHNGERAQLKRSSTRQFVDLATLMLLRSLAGQYPSSIWRPRGRVAIYPALSDDQWQWLEWCALAGPTPAWALRDERWLEGGL